MRIDTNPISTACKVSSLIFIMLLHRELNAIQNSSRCIIHNQWYVICEKLRDTNIYNLVRHVNFSHCSPLAARQIRYSASQEWQRRIFDWLSLIFSSALIETPFERTNLTWLIHLINLPIRPAEFVSALTTKLLELHFYLFPCDSVIPTSLRRVH